MAYRSLRQTLEQQRVSLEAERRELDDEIRRVEGLRRRRAEVADELRNVEESLDGVADQHHLAAFGRIAVASPCKVSWESMGGDERVRFCYRCSKHVYNLSAMTSEEAVSLVYEKEGELCARFYRRADGSVLTRDCPEGARTRSHRRLALAAAVTLAAGAACASEIESHTESVVMGKVSEITEL